MPDSIVSLTPGKSDAVIAAEIKAEANEVLKKVVEIMERARNNGMNLSFTINPDQFGRMALQPIILVKIL